MSHVTAGRMNKQIAGEIGLNKVTVKLHRGNMIAQDARKIAELVPDG